MATRLHLLTRSGDTLAQDIIAQHQQLPGEVVHVIDLTRGEVDYDALVEALFAHESVQVW